MHNIIHWNSNKYNFKVDSRDINKEQEKEREERRRKEKEERARERERREKEREERNAKENKDTNQSSRSRDSTPPPVKPEQPPPAQPASEPAQPPAPPPDSGYPGAGDRQTQTLAALEQAKQVELQKKLSESGSESVSLSQQENIQIKGQSARHLVMQKLIGFFESTYFH